MLRAKSVPPVGAHTVTVVVTGIVVWLTFSLEVHPVDLWVFLDAARAITHGASPYVNPSLPDVWSGHAFVYPYLTAWWFVPLALVPAAAAGLIFFGVSVGSLALAARLLAGRNPGIPAVVLATAAEPVVRGLQLGTLNAALLLGLGLAWCFRDRTVLLVVALCSVVVAKLFLVPMVVWLALTRRIRASVAVVALSAIAVVVGCTVGGVGLTAYLRMLSVLSAHEAPHSSSTAAVFLAAGATGQWATVLAWVVAVVVIMAGAVWARRRSDERLLFLACLIASIVASPIVWSHYYTLLAAVPLVLRWRTAHVLTALGCSWLIGIPDEGAALRVLHPFAGAGYLWALLLAAAIEVSLLIRLHRGRDHEPADRAHPRAGA